MNEYDLACKYALRGVDAPGALLRLVAVRFGPAVHAELRPQVERTANVAALDRCLGLVFDNKLYEVRQVLSADS